MKSQPAIADSAREAPASPPPPPKPTLLIVDDDAGPRESLRLIFRNDYQVLAAADGFEALRLVKEHAVDAAVLDLRMPGMSGLELLEKLRGVSPETGVIILTGYESLETARQALRLGASDYFAKPFDLTVMRAAVAAAAEKYARNREPGNRDQLLERLREELREYRQQAALLRQHRDLYACVLHDLNNPLTVISTALELLQEEIAQTALLTGEELKLLKDEIFKVKQQAQLCLDISHRYLKLLSGHTSPATAATPLNQTLRDLNVLMSKHRSRNGHKLEIQPLPEEVKVRMNGLDLLQTLINLTVNALQCTEQIHQVRVGATLLTAPLNLSDFPDQPGTGFLNRDGFVNQAPLVRITVQDDGPGIPDAALSRLFAAFTSTRVTEGGTGLGLLIVARLVHASRAALHLRTRAAEGTQFSLFVPVKVD